MLLLCTAMVLGAGSVVGEEPALDPSDVVLAFDFSNSILLSETDANIEFAQALDKIADRVAETTTDLVKGDATISFEAFGRKAVLYPGCTGIALRGNRDEVRRLENCLRAIAGEYRAGRGSPIGAKVGSADTDHVAALSKAATVLPPGSKRPAVVLFTDGKHDPKGKKRDKEDVAAKIAPTYRGFDPLAILPVGLGKIATQFETELQAIHIQNSRGMSPCTGREQFKWNDVVFPSPEAAGDAVAQALQEVTCSFTVKPAPTPSPTPTPVPTPIPAAPGSPQTVAAEPANEGLRLTWRAPTNPGTSPITGYTVHCRRTDTGAWESPTTASSILTEVQLNDLEPGYPYECQVAAINAIGQGDWSASSAATAPLGFPPTPGRPSAAAGNAEAEVSVPDLGQPSVLVDSYVFECADGIRGAEVSSRTTERSATVTGLVNGTEYTCVAYAQNPLGTSAASEASEAFRPCSNLFECNPWTRWIALLLLVLLGLLLLWLLFRYLRGPRRWFRAVLDSGEIRDLGWGPRIGARIDHQNEGPILRSDRRPTTPIRIRDRRSAFVELTSRSGLSKVRPGDPATITDEDDGSYTLILYRTKNRPQGNTTPGGEDDAWSPSGASSKGSVSTDDEVWS